MLSIDLNSTALLHDTASSNTTASLYLNVARLLCVTVGFGCLVWTRYSVMARRGREEEEESGGGGGGGGSGGGSSGGGGGSSDGAAPSAAATTGGYAMSDDDQESGREHTS